VTQRSAFDTDEWSLLRSVPILVAGAMAAVEPSGIIGALQEAAASSKALQQFPQEHPQNELVGLLTRDESIPAMPSPKQLLGEGTREQQAVNFTAAVMTRLHEALALLERKATPEEATGYKQLVMQVATDVANADVEGGFFGFGGKRVTENEQSLLEQLSVRLGSPFPLRETHGLSDPRP
jgi:hypothetical protein